MRNRQIETVRRHLYMRFRHTIPIPNNPEFSVVFTLRSIPGYSLCVAQP